MTQLTKFRASTLPPLGRSLFPQRREVEQPAAPSPLDPDAEVTMTDVQRARTAQAIIDAGKRRRGEIPDDPPPPDSVAAAVLRAAARARGELP